MHDLVLVQSGLVLVNSVSRMHNLFLCSLVQGQYILVLICIILSQCSRLVLSWYSLDQSWYSLDQSWYILVCGLLDIILQMPKVIFKVDCFKPLNFHICDILQFQAFTDLLCTLELDKNVTFQLRQNLYAVYSIPDIIKWTFLATI